MFFAGESVLLDELRPPPSEDPAAGVRSIGDVLGELLARYQPLEVGTQIGGGAGNCGGAGA